jgi:SAM-dependent methyltransferase
MTADPATNSQGPQGPSRRSTLTPDYQRDWEEYYAAVEGKPPRDTLKRAIAAFAKEDAPIAPGIAIDIACGSGRDSVELLRHGWRVVATDYHPAAKAFVTAAAGSDAFRFVQAEMESLPASPQMPRSADLINASFALPFCKPAAFPALWSWIVTTLRPGGRFAGQLFGDRDEWRPVRPESHFTRDQVVDLLKPFSIEHLDEVEKEGDDATGKPKYHHVFHIVARKT